MLMQLARSNRTPSQHHSRALKGFEQLTVLICTCTAAKPGSCTAGNGAVLTNATVPTPSLDGTKLAACKAKL